MNKDKIEALAVAVENAPVLPDEFDTEPYFAPQGFSMVNYFHECGTPSCMAGFALEMEGEEFYSSNVSVAKRAAKVLDIDLPMALSLFQPFANSAYHITGKQAAIVLRNLAETGEVDFSLVCDTTV